MTDHARTRLPDPRVSPRFAGVSTFCRFPLLESLDEAPDWVVYGVPFDGGVTYRPGARFGPRAIREQSAYVKPYHLEHGFNLAEMLSIADGGDAPVRPFSVKETQDAVCAYASSLGEQHTRLLAVGGDHSVALSNIRATQQRHGSGRPLAVLHFDAHLDTVDTVWGEKHTHASPFIRAIEEGLIDPKRMISVGIRGPLNRGDDLDYGRSQGIEVVTFADWRHRDGAQRLSDFVQRLIASGEPTYLSFDIDVLDPAFAPGTGTPCPGGFSAADCFDLLRTCRGANLVGADVVEVLPALDPTGATALLAGHILFEILCAACP